MAEPKRTLRVGVAVLAVVVVGTGAVVVVEQYRDRPQQVATGVPTSTATVVRTDLVDTVSMNGTLGYAGSYTIANQAGGVYTALPALGAVIRRGQALYEVDGRRIVLFYGARPGWRTLSLGVPDGPDVAQLKQNLVALGFASVTVTDHFDLATYYAVRRWQAALGVTVTGTVALSDVVYAAGPIRVDNVQGVLGGPAQPGAVLQATGTEPIVNLSVPVTQEYLAKVGDRVSVTLPDGVTSVAGTITSESAVATQAGDSQNAGPGPTGDPNAPANVSASVRLANAGAAAAYDQAPVTVRITDQSVRGVLAVPINALVALAGGGYGVWVVRHGARTLVGVHTGLFSDTLVQVSGDIQPGMTVEVPAS